MKLTKELEIAKTLAKEAGKKILEVYDSDSFEVTQKGDKGPLTKADIAANKIIVENLRKEFPEHAIFTEEETDDKKRLENEHVWIIDPLDGTKEFIAKNGEFTVNIALVFKQKPVLGVVYAPVMDELYFASEGNGSYLQKNGKIEKIRVSDRKNLNEMVLVQSRSHPSENLTRLISKHSFASIKTCGSSLKGCQVALGNADVYIRFGPTHEWDVCAMDIIVHEAGGFLTDLNGKSLTYNNENTLINGFFVSNNTMHNQLLKRLIK